ncbi:E3 ubiquitin-protein ligase TRIM71-like [Ptychodera flava]|uniref:E3 ubiquitin-protein ligase TRIM71-like n=1 Tax=Ptychodera flava TaxID=63121 RepID=UPI00396A10E1
MVSYIEMLRHHKNAADLVTAKKSVTQRIEELLRIDSKAVIQQNIVEFKPYNEIKKRELIGHILYYPCITQCTVDTVPHRLIKGQRVDFVIAMKDRRGEVVNTKQKVKVTLTSPDGSCKDVTVTENGDGTHTVTVHGEMVGDYKVSISVSGQAIPGSPFDFRVLIPLVRTFGGLGDEKGYFNHPRGLAFDSNGNLVVADQCNSRVQVIDRDGCVKKIFTFTEFAPLDVAISKEVFDENDRFVRAFGSFGEKEGHFKRPSGIVVSQDKLVYVVDQYANNIQAFDVHRKFIHRIDSGEDKLDHPMGIAQSRDDPRKLFVTDNYNHCIKVFID